MSFNDLLEAEYRGFGTGIDMNLDDLRLLYYGRPNVFISFSDEGEHEIYTQTRELDRPRSILAYSVNDVVGRKVRSPDFYMNVFRPSVSRTWLKDIRRYTREDLNKDMEKLKEVSNMNSHEWILFSDPIMKDVKIRHQFERLWKLTFGVAIELNRDDVYNVWCDLLLWLGYSAVSDPDGTGILALGRTPVSLFFETDGAEDLDVLPAQKRRRDPRRHTREKIERMRKRMRNSRNRVAKRRDPIIFGRSRL